MIGLTLWKNYLKEIFHQRKHSSQNPQIQKFQMKITNVPRKFGNSLK